MEKLLGSLDIDHTQYKFGHTKVQNTPSMNACEDVTRPARALASGVF